MALLVLCAVSCLAKDHEACRRPVCMVCSANATHQINGTDYCEKHYTKRMAKSQEFETVKRWYEGTK